MKYLGIETMCTLNRTEKYFPVKFKMFANRWRYVDVLIEVLLIYNILGNGV